MLRFVYAVLKHSGNDRKEDYGNGNGGAQEHRYGRGDGQHGGNDGEMKVVLVSWLRDGAFWKREGGRGVCLSLFQYLHLLPNFLSLGRTEDLVGTRGLVRIGG